MLAAAHTEVWGFQTAWPCTLSQKRLLCLSVVVSFPLLSLSVLVAVSVLHSFSAPDLFEVQLETPGLLKCAVKGRPLEREILEGVSHLLCIYLDYPDPSHSYWGFCLLQGRVTKLPYQWSPALWAPVTGFMQSVFMGWEVRWGG